MKPNADNKSSQAPGFQSEQLRKLHKPLDHKHVYSRDVEGRQLSYIEGWYAISKANEIFGYAGWDRETVHIERVLDSVKAENTTCGYIARIRVRVRAGAVEISREGTGCGFATARTPGAAHERALKAAETDATKRALSTFGPQFGLHLYDKGREAEARQAKFILFGPDGRPISDNLPAQALLGGLRQLVEQAQQPAEIKALLLWNNGSLTAMRGAAPELRNGNGTHFTDLLLRLAERCISRMEAAEAKSGDEVPEPHFAPLPSSNPHLPKERVVAAFPGAEPVSHIQGSVNLDPTSLAIGFAHPPENEGAAASAPQPSDATDIDSPSKIGTGDRVDRSALKIGQERRFRSKAHLKKVSELPCLICNRQPSHAHHVKYAQRRGLSQKVSDEFVVPLCALHHGDLHRAASERDWWEKQGQDPLAVAAGLWDGFRRNLN